MSKAPPPVREADFLAVDTANEADIKQRFNAFLRLLHSYLNELACLRNVQRARRRWTRPRETDAFGNFATDPNHWYTFHHGGRNEAQFNVGLWPSYLRVGLGFEFTLKKHGDPTTVHLAYACFRNVVKANRSQFERFVAENQLEIEWTALQAEIEGGPVRFIPTDDVVTWLLEPPRETGVDFRRTAFEAPSGCGGAGRARALGNVMQGVLCGFRPLWEQTQVLAHT